LHEFIDRGRYRRRFERDVARILPVSVVGVDKIPWLEAKRAFRSCRRDGEISHPRFVVQFYCGEVFEGCADAIEKGTEDLGLDCLEFLPEQRFVFTFIFANLWKRKNHHPVQEVFVEPSIVNPVQQDRALGIENGFFVIFV
jgi:hypothetical protein